MGLLGDVGRGSRAGWPERPLSPSVLAPGTPWKKDTPRIAALPAGTAGTARRRSCICSKHDAGATAAYARTEAATSAAAASDAGPIPTAAADRSDSANRPIGRCATCLQGVRAAVMLLEIVCVERLLPWHVSTRPCERPRPGVRPRVLSGPRGIAWPRACGRFGRRDSRGSRSFASLQTPGLSSADSA